MKNKNRWSSKKRQNKACTVRKSAWKTVCLGMMIVCILPISVCWSGEQRENSDARQMQSDFTIEDGILYQYNGSGGAVIIPPGVRTIKKTAFQWNDQIESIVMPDEVCEVEAYSFSECHQLRKVILSENLKDLEGGVFDSCYQLEEIQLPAQLERIGNEAFSYCQSLREVTVPSGVLSIASFAFANCINLNTITISSGVTTLENWIFMGCEQLQAVYGEEGSAIEQYSKKQGLPFVRQTQQDSEDEEEEKKEEELGGELEENDELKLDDNGNQTIDLEDARRELRIVLGILFIEKSQFDNYDVNKDGQLNLDDARIVLRYAIGIRARSAEKGGEGRWG